MDFNKVMSSYEERLYNRGIKVLRELAHSWPQQYYHDVHMKYQGQHMEGGGRKYEEFILVSYVQHLMYLKV